VVIKNLCREREDENNHPSSVSKEGGEISKRFARLKNAALEALWRKFFGSSKRFGTTPILLYA
jgi:hypothetical protein|tara:strand:+ start:162 stop:350 length:189 start_codon:yes stop_codon:yes gene_type:complete